MHAIWLTAVLLLQAPAQDDANKAAAELLKKVEDKVMSARTLHVEFAFAPSAGGPGETLKGEIRIGEGGAFYCTMSITRKNGRVEEVMIRSDGRTIIGTSPRPMPDFAKWKPAVIQRFLRRAVTQASFLIVYPVFGLNIDPEGLFDEFAPRDVKFEGKEKVGDVEATKISFALNPKEGPRRGLVIKLWIDPVKLNVLKRFVQMDQPSNETASRFELNPEFPADFFEFQTAAMLQGGREIQLARAVALHARYTGRLPKTLEDLKRRPADLPSAVFWPEGGFWIAGEVPKDIPYTVDAAGFTLGSIKEPMPPVSPVGAPTDRLKKFFTARVTIHLLKAAAHGFAKATGSNPAKPDDLVKKPEASRHWPEGGWIGGGRLPVDPWGEPYSIGTGASFTVSVAKSRGRMLKLPDLTQDERRALDEVAMPALSEKGAAEVADLFKGLGAEKLADRDETTKAILLKGGGALKPVMDRLAVEKDPEVAARLGLIADHFRSQKQFWTSEMKGGRFSLSGTGGDLAMIPANERDGMITLKTFTTAQADFRSNDRDGNRICDFYCRDVAGLFALVSAAGKETEAKAGKAGDPTIRLIQKESAKADATEDRWEYPVLAINDPEPKMGYLFAVLKNYEERGKTFPYHDGSGRNSDKFGFIAYPAEYGVTGRRTFLVNEDNMIFGKDLGGEDVDTFPEAPATSGWARMD